MNKDPTENLKNLATAISNQPPQKRIDLIIQLLEMALDKDSQALTDLIYVI